MYKITVDVKNRPKGDDILVDGLGQFKNGSTNEVDDSAAENFRNHNMIVTIEEGSVVSKKGPTLLQSFRNHPYISVEKVEEQKPKDNEDFDPELDVPSDFGDEDLGGEE